jgi:hypothetical protein
MLTMPKLMEPLQIALAILISLRPWAHALGSPPEGGYQHRNTPLRSFPHRRRRYPQVYQHNLLINNELRRWIISRLGDGCCGMSHTGD